ncbi:MAG: ABC transporter substrate-binding protein [Lachnospiraceae bacterium]|nr:ABC transporter substrate-binding protein [Lachnospiraceae bacterium]
MKKFSKKILSPLLCILLLLSSVATGCSGSKKNSETLVLNEVAHSVFYAPLYVAMEEGYFQEEGLDIELICGFGADKTMTALLSGEADLGLLGPEATIYTNAGGLEDPVVNIAQLTKRAGNFLIAREEMPNFAWSDLAGKNVLGGRKGGMPQMVFEYILQKNNLNPASDLTIDQSIDFGSTAAAFSSGKGDFTVEFEPAATSLENMGEGYHVVASLGVDSGYVPYTAFAAKESFMKQNPAKIQKFVNALSKGMEYVDTHTPEEIAKIIKPQFEETDLDSLTTIVERYHSQDSWNSSLRFEEDSFKLLVDILANANELPDANLSYEDIVNNQFVDTIPQTQ